MSGDVPTIVRERRRREVEPIIGDIQRCLQMIAGPAGEVKDERRHEAKDLRTTTGGDVQLP